MILPLKVLSVVIFPQLAQTFEREDLTHLLDYYSNTELAVVTKAKKNQWQ